VLVRVCPDVFYALFTVFVLTYMTKELGMSRGEGLAAVMIGSGLQLALMPLAGALSDRINRRKMYLAGTIAAGIWPFVFFPMASGGSFGAVVFGIVIALVIHAALYGPQAALVTEQFSPRLRYTGSSLAYTLAGVVGGALAPLLFTALLAGFGTWVPLAIYVGVTAVVSVIGVILAHDPDESEYEEPALTIQKRRTG
jgi:MFS family permease